MYFARKLKVENFSASDGWVKHWKARFHISFKKVSGEGNAYTSDMNAIWTETTLATILANYKLHQIYNADEFGLFYQAHPDKSLHLEKESFVAGKHSKVRLTDLAAANVLGDKLLMFVIGKSRKHLYTLKHLPCRYRN